MRPEVQGAGSSRWVRRIAGWRVIYRPRKRAAFGSGENRTRSNARLQYHESRGHSSIACFVPTVLMISITGCAQVGSGVSQVAVGATSVNRAADLGLPPLAPPPLPAIITEESRNEYIEQWMARSDELCRVYKDRLISLSRDQRLATDISQTILSGLATIFTKLAVVHPLTGAATIVSGVGASMSADFFARQTGDVLASAIQSARENQANQIEINLRRKLEDYNLYRAERDVVDYHDMCSLETGFVQIRASLRATSPDAGTTPPAAQGQQTNTNQAAVAAVPAPPPAPAPLPAPTPLPAVPATPPVAAARAGLYTVMGLSPRGSADLIKTRRAMFDRCATGLLGSPPRRFTDWALSADSDTLVKMTQCINNTINAPFGH